MLGEILIALAVLTLFCLSGSSFGDRRGYYDDLNGFVEDNGDLFDD